MPEKSPRLAPLVGDITGAGWLSSELWTPRSSSSFSSTSVGTGWTVIVALGPIATSCATRAKLSKHHSRMPLTAKTPRAEVGTGKSMRVRHPPRGAAPARQTRGWGAAGAPARSGGCARPESSSAGDPRATGTRRLVAGVVESRVTLKVARLPASASLVERAAVTCQRPRARPARCALCTRPVATSASSPMESSTSSSAPRATPATALRGVMAERDRRPRVVSVVRRCAIRFVGYPAATGARFGARTGTGTLARSSATSAVDE